MPKKYSGKPFKDSSSMKKSKLSFLESLSHNFVRIYLNFFFIIFFIIFFQPTSPKDHFDLTEADRAC